MINTNIHSSQSCQITLIPNELKNQMVEAGTWKLGCPVDISRLRLIKFPHYDFSGVLQEGNMVVLDAVAARVALIFETLYQYKFAIAQAKTIEHYQGQDKASMAANNSSAFNYRPIANKTLLSVHSYGVAIDLNPIQNPCIAPQTIIDSEEVLVSVQPAKGQEYLNRTKIRPGMVEQNLDETIGLTVVQLFKQNGFCVWGGTWNDPIDWQHFQPSRVIAEWLAFMSPEDAEVLFELYISRPALLNNPKVRDFNFKTLYEKDPSYFMQTIQKPEFWNLLPEEAFKSFLCHE